MLRKILCILSAVSMFAYTAVSSQAGGITGSIRVVPHWIGRDAAEEKVALYRIGDVTSHGYRITDGLADWILYQQEITTDDFLQWALEQPWECVNECIIQRGEGAFFHNLTEGLYMVVQKQPSDGREIFRPFLITLSAQNGMDIVFYPGASQLTESPQTGDYPLPIFAAMLLSIGAVALMILAENRKK